MCFRKKVLSSDNCHTMRRRDTATTLMVDEWGSSQRTLYQLQNQSIETVLSTLHTLMVHVCIKTEHSTLFNTKTVFSKKNIPDTSTCELILKSSEKGGFKSVALPFPP